MKKLLFIIVTLFMVFQLKDVKAITLKEYEDKVTKYQNELNAAKAGVRQTEQQIQNTKNEIQNIKVTMQNLETEITNLRKQVEDGKVEIKEKSLEIKNFFSYLQLSKNENAYLEYAFGAETITDFIYRLSIVEQMTEYNNEIISNLETMIERNAKREEEIKKRQVQLTNMQKTLDTKIVSLGEQKVSYESGGVDSAKQLKIYQDIVASYKKLGCKSHHVIGVDCATTGGAGVFRRPTKVGQISSEFGKRWGKLHRGLDITSPNMKNEKIYTVANGTISAVFSDSYGAKCIVLEHRLDNKWYTSMYCHMSSYAPNMYVGRYLTSDDYVGYMGNTGYVIPAPTPKNPNAGTHLHMEIAPCRIFKDNSCIGWVEYVSFLTNQASRGFKGPRALIGFPNAGVTWYSR